MNQPKLKKFLVSYIATASIIIKAETFENAEDLIKEIDLPPLEDFAIAYDNPNIEEIN